MSIINNMPVKGGMDINGLIKEYYVYAGENISAGSFVEFINGVAVHENRESQPLEYTTIKATNVRTCLVDDNKVMIYYYTSNSGSYLKNLVIAEISNISITLGTSIILPNASDISQICTVEKNKVLVCYRNNSNNTSLSALIATVNGTTITLGQEYNRSGSSGTIGFPRAAFLVDTNKVCIIHDNWKLAVVATVLGNTISFGNNITLITTATRSEAACLIANNKIMWIYCDDNNSYYGTGRVLSISGTNVSVGSTYVFNQATTTTKTCCPIDTNKILIVYSKSAKIASISGTSISYGTEYTALNGAVSFSDPQLLQLGTNKALLIYNNYGGTKKWQANVITISNSVITVGSYFQLTTEKNTIFYIGNKIEENKIILGGNCELSLINTINNMVSREFEITEYEQQVKNVSTIQCNGVAKTNGVGGDTNVHRDKITIYTPNI